MKSAHLNTPKRQVVVYPDAETLAASTAARLLTELTDILAVKERADIVLTGGTVGIATLRAVAESPLAQTVDWSAVHVWWGDERFVDAGDPDRNEGQAQEALLSHVPIPQENIHRMGSANDYDAPETAAAVYHDEIAHQGAAEFDVLMLGVGPDGHVASLFPGHDVYLHAAAEVCVVTDSPKPPPVRVTLSVGAINRAKKVWLVAAGEEKAHAIAECLQDNAAYPGAAVRGTEQTLWLIDTAAASKA
jgi:6-phosphogluconolactonase